MKSILGLFARTAALFGINSSAARRPVFSSPTGTGASGSGKPVHLKDDGSFQLTRHPRRKGRFVGIKRHRVCYFLTIKQRDRIADARDAAFARVRRMRAEPTS